ncbi:MAG: sigma-70 family RNA polymerase sigma factor [Bacteroidetes bacterium]|nr:sigma-70 family RNA polymerase sigma factor [Bacteroidota bacterium]
MNKQIDEEIVQACLRNEAKAQKALYDFFSRTMFAVCLRYCNTHEDAMDVLQEGFIKVFTRLNQFSGKGSLEGWMKRVFINTALEHYRVNKVYQEQSDVEMANDNPVDGYVLEKISQKEIFELLNQLAPGYRTVLNLYAIEGYNHAEIAEMLGISEGTSKSQLSRARSLFAQAYAKRNNIKQGGR